MGTLLSKSLKYGAGNLINDVVDIGGSAVTFSSSRKDGDSFPVSIGKTAFDFAIGALMPWQAQLAYGVATAGFDMVLQASKSNADLQKQMMSTGSGRVGSGTFNMSNAGYTMRQRALNQIRSNGQNVNSVLGNEARNFVKSSRNYY